MIKNSFDWASRLFTKGITRSSFCLVEIFAYVTNDASYNPKSVKCYNDKSIRMMCTRAYILPNSPLPCYGSCEDDEDD